LTLDQLLEVPLVRRCWDQVAARYPDVPTARLLRELVREQIGLMVSDLIATTRSGLAEAGLDGADVAAIRAAGRPLVCFSDRLHEEERALKRFMYANLYHHPQQRDAAARARIIVADLFGAYQADPALMGAAWDASCVADEPARSRHIADYIAGMTDRFAERSHAAIFGDTAPPGAPPMLDRVV
jgi:dGTPase